MICKLETPFFDEIRKSQIINHFLHLVEFLQCRLKESPLRTGAHHVVARILYFIIGVAIDVIGKETHGLHVWKQQRGIRKIFFFNWQ